MLTVEPQPIPLTTTADGGIRVTGTRVPLETIVRAFHQGDTPEEIVQDFQTLTLAQVYAVLAYYLWHRDAVDAYVAERAALALMEAQLVLAMLLQRYTVTAVAAHDAQPTFAATFRPKGRVELQVARRG